MTVVSQDVASMVPSERGQPARWRPFRGGATGALLVAVAVVAGCSGSDGGSAAPAVRQPLSDPVSTTQPPECDDFLLGGAVPSPECATARLEQALDHRSTAGLGDLSIDEATKRADAVCATVAASPPELSTRANMVRSVIDDVENLSPQAIGELVDLARNVCPNEFREIDIAPAFFGSLRIAYIVEGVGPVRVVTTSPNGEMSEESVTAPWRREVDLDRPTDLRVDAYFDTAENGSCALDINGVTVVADALRSDDEVYEVRCSVGAFELEYGDIAAAVSPAGAQVDADTDAE